MVGPKQISDLILEQLGGSYRLSSMIGAKNFSYDANGALSFHFKGSRKANMVRILLLPSDTYTLVFTKFNARTLDVQPVGLFENIYVLNLIPVFEQFTGLALRL